MMKLSNADRYWQTIRLMAPSQVAHRLRLRSQRAAYQRIPERLIERWSAGIPRTGTWPAVFQPIDRGVEHPPIVVDNGQPVFELLGEKLDLSTDGWRSTKHTQLFRYHLHYFEWAWPMALQSDQQRFAELWASWQAETTPGRWDEWSPYVVALRSWVLCGVFDQLIRSTSIENEVVEHQRAALGFFDHNLELDVGGNHLIKNLKAVIGLAVFFDDQQRLEHALGRLAGQLDRQVLDDGGHFELSPSYHAQVMTDLVDITNLCEAANVPMPFDGRSIVKAMSSWLTAMTFPDRSLPMLGDCTPPLEGVLDQLATSAQKDESTPGIAVHPDTGYVSVRQGNTMLVVDFGPPCPPELPAHAQADWGSFELWSEGDKVICDPGVSTYVGPQRAIERSTSAHNTVTVGDRNQTDVWSSFRAGKRAVPSPIDVSGNSATLTISGSLVDIHGVSHHRRFELTSSELRIVDTIDPDDGNAISRLNLAADSDPSTIRGTNAITVDSTSVATGFGKLVEVQRLSQPLVNRTASWTVSLRSSYHSRATVDDC